MTQETTIHVLMYLFNNYFPKELSLNIDFDICDRIDDGVFEDLKKAGFGKDSIARAVEWLEELSNLTDIEYAVETPKGIRIFSPEERFIFDNECRAFLLHMLRCDVVPWAVFELIVHFTLKLNISDIDVSLIKWVSFMVLSNFPGSSTALKKLELLILSDGPSPGLLQ